jgi:hypothetical protein
MRRFLCAGAPSPAWFIDHKIGAAMNANSDFDRIELDEIPEEVFLTIDPIGLTFANGIHESDLLSSVERAKHLAGETY